MFIMKPQKCQQHALKIYLAETCHHKFSQNIWTCNSALGRSCQTCNLKAAFTVSPHKEVLITRQMVLSSSHWDNQNLSVQQSRAKLSQHRETITWAASKDQSACLLTTTSNKDFVFQWNAVGSRQSTTYSVYPSLFSKIKTAMLLKACILAGFCCTFTDIHFFRIFKFFHCCNMHECVQE